jgi:thymidylate synthase (FAD)
MEAKLKVTLVSHTPEPEMTVSAAAKLCYSPADVEEILLRRKDGGHRKFLEKLTAMGHMSPIEHVSFTFAIEGISRACSHQLVRHRLASFSQQSQRYVGKEHGFRYIMPPAIGKDDALRQRFEELMEAIAAAYKDLAETLVERGRSREEAREDARFVLPNASETKIIMTMNARELLHFFSQRLCMRAQWEIRDMALAILGLVKPIAPTIFRLAGPPCVTGACPEGAHGCGKARGVRRFFCPPPAKER